MELVLNNPGNQISLDSHKIRIKRIAVFLEDSTVAIVVSHLNQNGTIIETQRIVEKDKPTIDNILSNSTDCSSLKSSIYSYLEGKVDGTIVDNEIIE